jgi:predicted RNase H-like HicB family nuclease
VAQAMNKKIFHVTARQEGNYYLIRFPEHPQLFTQATHIREVEMMSRDVINLALEIPLEEIELNIEYLSNVAVTL